MPLGSCWVVLPCSGSIMALLRAAIALVLEGYTKPYSAIDHSCHRLVL